MIRIGATETYEPCYCINEWYDRYNDFDFVLFITKNLTPEFIKLMVMPDSPWYCNRISSVIHVTCTGWGGTPIEPNVDEYMRLYDRVQALIKLGYPLDRIVLRVDPILPTKDGILKFYNVTRKFSDLGIKRCRISIMDLYNHVRDRISNCDEDIKGSMQYILNSYGDSFHAPISIFEDIQNLIVKIKLDQSYQFESCAENRFDEKVVRRIGCVSKYDLAINGLNINDVQPGHQRSGCLCLMKKQLIPGGMSRGRCPNKCIYCYLKDKE